MSFDEWSVATKSISQQFFSNSPSLASNASGSPQRYSIAASPSGIDKWRRVSHQLNQLIDEDETPSKALHSLDNAGVLEAYKNLDLRFRRLKVENLVFHRFLEKNEPDALEEMEGTGKRAERMSIAVAYKGSAISKTPRMSSMSFPTVITALSSRTKERTISFVQKSDLVARDLEMVQAKLEVARKKSQNARSNLKAKLEEIECRKEELETSISTFEKFRSSYEQVPLEKFARFMDEWSKKSRLMADKIRLRFSSTKVYYHKLSGILAHKQLIGENLQEIDFENLRIENLHLIEKIEMKVHLLYELKKMTGKNNLKLSQHKTILEQQNDQKQSIQENIQMKELELAKCDEEMMKIQPELDQVKEEHDRVKDKVSKYKAPEILEYVKHKVKLDNLKKEVKTWNRRKLIKETAFEIEICEMKKLLQCKTPHPCWVE